MTYSDSYVANFRARQAQDPLRTFAAHGYQHSADRGLFVGTQANHAQLRMSYPPTGQSSCYRKFLLRQTGVTSQGFQLLRHSTTSLRTFAVHHAPDHPEPTNNNNFVGVVLKCFSMFTTGGSGEWPVESRLFVVELLNDEPGPEQTKRWIKAIRLFGATFEHHNPSFLFPRRWHGYNPIETKIGTKDFEDRARAWNAFRGQQRSRPNIDKVFLELRSTPLKALRALLFRELWRCRKCGKFFTGSTTRARRVYCSKKCGWRSTATAAVNRQLQHLQAKRLREVLRILSTLPPSKDWKIKVARNAGVTPNWITYAVKRGDIPASLTKHHQSDIGYVMKTGTCPTREAAKKIGVSLVTLQRHVAAGTVDAPPLQKVGPVSVRLWSARDIDKARKVLATVRPGRKKKKV